MDHCSLVFPSCAVPSHNSKAVKTLSRLPGMAAAGVAHRKWPDVCRRPLNFVFR